MLGVEKIKEIKIDSSVCCEDLWDKYLFDSIDRTVDKATEAFISTLETCCRFVDDARDLINFLFF